MVESFRLEKHFGIYLKGIKNNPVFFSAIICINSVSRLTYSVT